MIRIRIRIKQQQIAPSFQSRSLPVLRLEPTQQFYKFRPAPKPKRTPIEIKSRRKNSKKFRERATPVSSSSFPTAATMARAAVSSSADALVLLVLLAVSGLA